MPAETVEGQSASKSLQCATPGGEIDGILLGSSLPSNTSLIDQLNLAFSVVDLATGSLLLPNPGNRSKYTEDQLEGRSQLEVPDIRLLPSQGTLRS